MKKILTLLLLAGFTLFVATSCDNDKIDNNKVSVDPTIGGGGMQIQVQGEDEEPIIFNLNDSPAAKSLYNQLPITIELEDYSNDEKIFYPSKKLDIGNTPMAKGPAGTLAYYEPWGDVVMYYDTCGGASGLYALGEAITSIDQIKQLSGEVEISKYQTNTNQNSKIEENIPPTTNQNDTSLKEEDPMFHVQITIDSQRFTASLYDTASVRALMERLPLSLDMKDLHGNEKYYYFSTGLPTDAQNISQIYTGELKLFGRDCLVFFYKDFQTTYSYTSLGKIDNVQGFAQALGKGNVAVHIEEIE